MRTSICCDKHLNMFHKWSPGFIPKIHPYLSIELGVSVRFTTSVPATKQNPLGLWVRRAEHLATVASAHDGVHFVFNNGRIAIITQVLAHRGFRKHLRFRTAQWVKFLTAPKILWEHHSSSQFRFPTSSVPPPVLVAEAQVAVRHDVIFQVSQGHLSSQCWVVRFGTRVENVG